MWQTPKMNWNSDYGAVGTDFNRIEGNTLELKKAASIDISDTGGFFSSTTVEGALAELKTLCQ